MPKLVAMRAACAIERITGGLRAVGHADSKSCHAAEWIRSTDFALSPKRYKAHDAFPLPRQAGSYFQRVEAGLRVHRPARKDRNDMVMNPTGPNETSLVIKPTEEEKGLASQLKAAGNDKNGQWQEEFAKYSGRSVVVLTAAMQAALKHRDYEEGLKAYQKLEMSKMDLPAFTNSMKLLGKLGKLDEVERLWEQLLELGRINKVAAQARIDAAADNGDMEGAARVLNYMDAGGIEADTLHYSSALNACANAATAARSKSAQELFDAMVTKGIRPNIVTYTNLLRARQDEPSEVCLDILKDMKNRNVMANAVFAETFLFTLLQSTQKGGWTKVGVIAADLQRLPPADLQAAKHFIDELRDAKVHLSRSCKLIEAALQSVQRKKTFTREGEDLEHRRENRWQSLE